MSELRPAVELDNAREPEQRMVMEGILDDGVCPFCIESLTKYHKQPLLEQGEFWTVTNNQWPYKNTLFHLMLIAREHITTLDEFGDDLGPAFAELGRLAAKYIVLEGDGTAALGMRIGDPAETGGTVNHLHAHILRIDPKAPVGTKIKMKLGEIK